jgi:hypothetical protein
LALLGLLGLLGLLYLLYLLLLLLLLLLLMLQCWLMLSLDLLDLLQHSRIHGCHAATAKSLHDRGVYHRHWSTCTTTESLHGLHISLHILIILCHQLG